MHIIHIFQTIRKELYWQQGVLVEDNVLTHKQSFYQNHKMGFLLEQNNEKG